jgi:hypothetical protein
MFNPTANLVSFDVFAPEYKELNGRQRMMVVTYKVLFEEYNNIFVEIKNKSLQGLNILNWKFENAYSEKVTNLIEMLSWMGFRVGVKDNVIEIKW